MISLTLIQPGDPMSEGPATLNANFELIAEHFDALSDVLDEQARTLRLTTITTPAAGVAEMAALVLTATGGNVLTAIDTNGGVVSSLTAAGVLGTLKFVATGTGADASIFADLVVSGQVTIEGGTAVVVNSTLNQMGANARTLQKLRTVTVQDSNCGVSAASPLNCAFDHLVFLDYANAGLALAGQGLIKLDTTTLAEGQEFHLYCVKPNATGGQQGFYNGTSGSEVFAYLNPGSGGLQSLSNATSPKFTPGASPNTLSFLKVRWTNIGGGVFRLLILDHKNMTGVS